MTNEDAIKILERDRDVLGNFGGESAEALSMAIDALNAKGYKSEARRWKRRYLDLMQKIENQKKDLIEEIEDYWKDCDNDADDDVRCLRCNVVMFNSIIGMVKGVK